MWSTFTHFIRMSRFSNNFLGSVEMGWGVKYHISTCFITSYNLGCWNVTDYFNYFTCRSVLSWLDRNLFVVIRRQYHARRSWQWNSPEYLHFCVFVRLRGLYLSDVRNAGKPVGMGSVFWKIPPPHRTIHHTDIFVLWAVASVSCFKMPLFEWCEEGGKVGWW